MTKQHYPRIGESLYRETLSNGLEIMVVPRSNFAKNYAVFATRYGGMDMRFSVDGEWKDTPAGIAHYLEHKMFDTEEGNALQRLAQNGAEPNAFTGNGITAYYFDSTDHFLENLEILLSFVSVPYFTEESVEKERGIIAQEIRMIEDNPDWQVYMELMQGLYENAPVRVPVAGTVESIGEITAQTLYDCHRAFYAPGNMVLCVVGDVEPEEIVSLAEKILPKGKAPEIQRDYGEEEGLIAHCKLKEKEMDVSMPNFLVGYKCKPSPDKKPALRDTLIGDIACDVLLSESTPLYERLYNEGLINSSFGGGFEAFPGSAFFYAGGESNDPAAVQRAITQEAKRLAEEGVDEVFFQQIRKAEFGATLRSLNSFENVAVTLAENYFHGVDAFSFPEVFDTITKEDIEAFFRENIVEEHSALSVIRPRGDKEKEA